MSFENLGDTAGQWGSVSIAIPDFLQEVRDAVNDFSELLATLLEVANLALEFVKGFVKGYLDPLTVIIETIIAAIVEFIQSLQGIGIYLTGDWALLGWPPEDLLGGYASYERRMVARLVDRTDPTRPDVASTTSVLAFFAYMSVDPTDFERLINFVLTLRKLFGLSFNPDTSALPIPAIKAIKYGSSEVDTSFQFKPLGSALASLKHPPAQCRLTWVTQPASQRSPQNPFPVLGPSGYVVTVSTVPEGIPLKFARPRGNTDMKAAAGVAGNQVQPREYGDVVDTSGRPVVLHGGTEMLVFGGSGYEFNGAFSDGVLVPNYCQVYGQIVDKILPIEDLGPETGSLGTPGDGRGSEYLLQRSFLITDGVTLAQWFSGEYGAVFAREDLPRHAEWRPEIGSNRVRLVRDSVAPATTYYFRVWAVGKHVAEEKTTPKWDFKKVAYNGATPGQPFRVALQCGTAGIGSPSSPKKATFVGIDTADYLTALQTALLILVLTRTDLPSLSELVALKGEAAAARYRSGDWAGLGFALVPTGLEESRPLLQRLYSNIQDLEQPSQDPIQWRADLYNRIRVFAEELHSQSGTNARIERSVVAATEKLRTYTVSDFLGNFSGLSRDWERTLVEAGLQDCTLLEAFNPRNAVSKQLEVGFAPNMFSMGLKPTDVDELAFVPEVFQGFGDFATYTGGVIELVFEEPDPSAVLLLLSSLPEGLRQVYTKFVQADGSLSIPDEYRTYMQARRGDTEPTRFATSGDLTPVCVVLRSDLEGMGRNSTYFSERRDLLLRQNDIEAKGGSVPDIIRIAGIAFARGLHEDATLCAQAALVLRVATSVRAPSDGEWIAMRLFDAWPEVEEFLRAIETWAKSLDDAVKSMADAIVKYIEFVQGQVVELQQLIKRINALIQSFLSFSFALPQFSGLMLQSRGTDGVLADFVAAKNKPSDSPLSYGAGVLLVAPYAPGLILDIISVATATDDTPATQDINGTTTTTRPPAAVGTEAVAPTAGPPPTSEPDVL